MAVTTVENSALLNSYIQKQNAANSTTSGTSSSSKSSYADVTSDFNTFLNILTAQLKNQDPTEPMDASQFTQQLVQYSQVEQQIGTNDKLDQIYKALNSNNLTPLLSYVNQYVESTADGQISVQGGKAMMAFTLPEKAVSTQILIQDKTTGKTVATIDGPTAKGLNRVAWDGTTDTGTQAADGVYKYTLTAKDSSGKTITVDDQRVIGKITALETQSDGTVVLKAGDLEIKDTNIKSVFANVSTTSSSTTT